MDKEKNNLYEYSGKDFVCHSCGIYNAISFLVSSIRNKNRDRKE